MWIKVCATTSLDDALYAVDAGADAVGFVFATSPRRVTAEQVARITSRLQGRIASYGVFAQTEFEEIVATVNQCQLNGIQLYASGDPKLGKRLREHFTAQGIPMRIHEVLHFSPDLASRLTYLRENSAADAILVDSRTATAIGGTGIAFDWQEARSSFSSALPLIAAGGLQPGNVADAIHTLHPWGVDVASGVELYPGKKDPARVRAFVRAARAAFAEMEMAADPAGATPSV